MSIPNLIDCVERGRGKDLPELSLYGWALSVLDHDPTDWDEETIHVSDYKYALNPSEGGCDRQLWHRLRQDEREDPTLWKQLMWDQGTAMQMRYTWLMSHGLPDGWEIMEVEADISEGLPYDHTGSCDLILKGPDTLVAVEMKTVRGNAFRYLDEPKDSHEMQAQGEFYAIERMYPEYEVYQRVMYIDREGQNRPLVFPVKADDERIGRAAKHLNSIRRRVQINSTAPDPIAPEIEVRENKGPNSIYLSQVWVCDYCDYRGESCPGGLPDDLIGNGIVAKGNHAGPLDALDIKYDGPMGADILDYIDRATSAGNVKLK